MTRRIEQFGLLSERAGATVEQMVAALAEQRARLREAETRLEDLLRFQGEYTQSQGGVHDMRALLNRREFVQRIGEAMTFQRGVVARQREACAVAEQHLRAAHARACAIDHVHQKLRSEDQRDQERHEQAQMDELSLRARRMDAE